MKEMVGEGVHPQPGTELDQGTQGKASIYMAIMYSKDMAMSGKLVPPRKKISICGE